MLLMLFLHMLLFFQLVLIGTDVFALCNKELFTLYLLAMAWHTPDEARSVGLAKACVF